MKWLSRKLIVSVAGIVTLILVNAGMPENLATPLMDSITEVLVFYLIGQSAVDLGAPLVAKVAGKIGAKK